MACVYLPCDCDDWWEDKKLFLLLSHLRSLQEFGRLISAHTRVGSAETVISQRLKCLKGLQSFLVKYCSVEEEKTFFTKTLPFIAEAASRLDERVPESGIPFLEQQEAAALVLGRKLVSSLLSNAFLCTFPEVSPGRNPQLFNFKTFFPIFFHTDEGRHRSQAAKLKCILSYFNRAAEENCDLDGVITLRRQVIPKYELPVMAEWLGNQYPLCPISVDNDKGIEDAGTCTLQVDFANCCIGGGVLSGGRVQEEIRFCICPELLVSILIMDEMDSNEAIVVSGFERFADYKGYSASLEFGGDHIDTAERDVFGNVLSSLVAIDALPFTRNIKPSDQYKEEYILRELNKAYIGFMCQQHRGDSSTDLLALARQSSSVAILGESYIDGSGTHEALGNINILAASAPIHAVSISTSFTTDPSPLSPIQEVSESPRASLKEESSSFASSLVADIIKSGIQIARGSEDSGGVASKFTDSDVKNQQTTPVMPAVNITSKIDDLSSSLASAIIESSIPQKAADTARGASSTATADGTSPESQAEKLATSIISDVLSQPKAPTIPPQKAADTARGASSTATADGTSPKSQAEKLAMSIISDVLSQPKAPTVPSQKAADTAQSASSTATADGTSPKSQAEKLATSIISDVLSQPKAPTIPPQKAADTARGASNTATADGTSPKSQAEKLAMSIISDVLSQPKAPTVPSQKAADTAQSAPSTATADGTSPESQAEKLATSIISDVLSQPKAPTVPPQKAAKTDPSTTTADDATRDTSDARAEKLARSIISDVLSEPKAPIVPPQPRVQTVGQQSNATSSFASNLADRILLDAISTPTPESSVPQRPTILVQPERRRGSGESSRSSRSSSVTGQSITLHEYTDEFVESAMRDGIFIAQVTESTRQMEATIGLELDALANRIVMMSVKDALNQNKAANTAKEEMLKSPPASKPPLHPKQVPLHHRRAPSPGRPNKPGVSRQGIYKKRPSLDGSTDSDTLILNPLLLSTPSSRMSYAWSTASTHDEESRPVSPTDLDRIALGFTSNLDEYASLFAEMVICDALGEITGVHPLSPQHVPSEGGSVAPFLGYLPSDVEPLTNTKGQMKIDTFLSTLDQAEPLNEDVDTMTSYTHHWHRMQRALLRPVATGNWGSGAFKGNPQLKAMIQWMAVSASGRPVMMYFPFKEVRVRQLEEVGCKLISKRWTVGHLCQALIDFSKKEEEEKDLFATLLKQL